MTNKESIEIPLGAKDSEFKGWECTIPDGMEARIDGNKIIVEPKESEDEKIRKVLINIVKGACDKYGIKYQGKEITEEKLLAWLEKQGEHKPVISDEAIREGVAHFGITQYQINYWLKKYVDVESKMRRLRKIEPKFKVGDTIRLKGSYAEFKITEISISEGYYKGKGWSLDIMAADDDYELAEQNPADKVEPKFKIGDWVVNIITKEVEQVIEITGCEYICSGHLIVSFNNQHLLKRWTIEDAKDGDVLSSNDGHGNDSIELIKSITDKKIEFWFCLTNGNRYEVFDGITPYTNLASRQDATPATEEQCDTLYAKMKEAGYEWDAEKKELRKIEQKPSIEICPHSIKSKSYLETGYPVARNPAWSEEDEDAIGMAIIALEDMYDEDAPDTTYGGYNLPFNKAAERLKSLKERYTWKPSEKQMKILQYLCETSSHPNEEVIPTLESLYNDLKKLKG